MTKLSTGFIADVGRLASAGIFVQGNDVTYALLL